MVTENTERSSITTLHEVVRPVTDEEAAFFHEYGWVRLPSLLSPDLATQLLERAKDLMGENAVDYEFRAGKDHKVGFFEVYNKPSNDDPDFLNVARSRQLGQNAARLLGRDSSVKVLYDNLAVKRPEGVGGLPTDAHQDGIVLPFDRPSVALWIALDDLVPQQGLMRFRSHSHKLGPLGRRLFGNEADMEAYWPRLAECPRSESFPMRAGDATVHGSWTVHSAPPNTTDTPRWSLMLILFPGDSWHAQVHRTTENLNLPLRAPLEHPDFPTIYDPAS